MTDVVHVNTTFISTDVVCVKFSGPFVLAGVGGILKIFSVSLNKCVNEIEVFKGHKIHGIELTSRDQILIYGSKSVQIFIFSTDRLFFTQVASIALDDWVIAAHWLSTGCEVALVTAHNVAWFWNWKSTTRPSLMQVVCTEKCILYSATICGDEWCSCVVFAGTVFKEIVIWSPGGSVTGDQPVLHRLVGHNGVIFSLTWDGLSNSLCSTSDDRCVRLWKFFLPRRSDWKCSKVLDSSVFYGHLARVWKSIIIGNCIVSVGEDCQICLWNAKGNLLKTLQRYTSGCQWSLDFSAEYKLLVTGAGDGSVQLLPLILPCNKPAIESISYPDLIIQSIFSCARKIVMLMSGSIVAITEDGTLFSGSPDNTCSWKVAFQDDRFMNYCLLSIAPLRKKFALASLKGVVVVCQASSGSIMKVLEKKVEDGKIWSILWLSNEDILVCGDEGRLSVWHLSENQGTSLLCTGKFRLPRTRERWPSCATLVMTKSKRYMICGDRCGSLHLFKYQGFLSDENEYIVPDHSLLKLHGKLGASSVQVFRNKILSTGRDGTLRSLRIHHLSAQLSVISTDKMRMEWVCSVLCSPSSLKHFLIVGFKESKMIVWSTEERRVILQFECGGGHRSWDCILSDHQNLKVAFVRDKHLYHASWNVEELTKPTLLPGISPRELNCVCLVDSLPSVLLFGGEDSSIYICKFSEEMSSLVSKVALTNHISSVRCLCLHKNFLFSGGGRAQLKAWQIESESEEEIICVEEASHMIKGERDPRSPPSIDPEMRYMSICSVPVEVDNSSIVQLVAGYSDGALRWLTFDLVSKSIQIIGESMFHNKCVLKLLAIQLPSGKALVISAATDGRIALWDTAPDMFSSDVAWDPFWSIRCHQSGINSVHALLLPASMGTMLLLASGGDDNSVAVTALHLKAKNVSLVAKWSTSSVHAAQVTGVCLIEKWLISTSIDQRLTLWQWSFSVDTPVELKCDFVHQFICSVPDIQDMRVWQKNNHIYVCVVGKGVQILSVPLTEPHPL